MGIDPLQLYTNYPNGDLELEIYETFKRQGVRLPIAGKDKYYDMRLWKLNTRGTIRSDICMPVLHEGESAGEYFSRIIQKQLMDKPFIVRVYIASSPAADIAAASLIKSGYLHLEPQKAADREEQSHVEKIRHKAVKGYFSKN